MKKLLLLFILVGNIAFSQDGKITFKKKINLSKTKLWQRVSYNDTIQEDYAFLNKIDFYAIKYKSDSLTIKGMMILPKAKGKFPVVIFNRGGNRDYGKISLWLLYHYTAKLASKGYVVLASNYREKDEFGGKDINDVLNLIETTKTITKADTSKIGMFGWSRGGMMTYLALKNSNKIKTAIVGNGSTNLFTTMKNRPRFESLVYEQCIPNYYNNKEEELKKRSVVFWADKLNKKSSLLILAGTKDKKVNPEQADELAQKLKEINYNFELRKFDTNHSFYGKRDELDNLVINWFNTHLSSTPPR